MRWLTITGWMRFFPAAGFILTLLLFPLSAMALEGGCVAFCDDGGSSSGSDYDYSPNYDTGGSWDYSGPSAEEIRANQLREEAHNLNAQGNSAYESEDYETAVYYYEQALAKSPNDSVIYSNLESAKAFVYNRRGNALFEKEDWQSAIQNYEEALRHDPDDEVIADNLRRARVHFQETEKKRIQEENSQRAKREVDALIDDFNEEFKSTPKAPSLSVRSSSGSKKKSSGLQFKSLRTKRKQEDYYKTLKVKSIPLPKRAGSVKHEEFKEVTEGEGITYKVTQGFQKAGAGFSKWVKKKKQDFKLWTYSESFEQTAGRVPGVSKVKALGEKTKATFKKMFGMVNKVFTQGMEGAEEGSRIVASPYDDGSQIDGYYERTIEVGEEVIEESEGWAKEEIEGHLK